MKNAFINSLRFFSLIILFSSTTQLFAQVPQKFKYQGVLRNPSGTVIANQQVSVRFTIFLETINGPASYQETHFTSTNQFGLVLAEIGGGIVNMGGFANIDWTKTPAFLKIEVDPNGGNAYTEMGISQILSVPFAFHASTADSVLNQNDHDTSSTNELQTISISGNNLTISNGNTIDLSSFIDNTDNQQLTLSNSQLTISNGNSVNLSAFMDNTDSQQITFSGNSLSISNGNSVNLSSLLDNTDSQTLTFAANNLSITGGNSVNLSSLLDNTDNQTLSLNGSNLSILGGNIVNLSQFIDNTDNQSLLLQNNQLSITGGNSITLPSYLNGNGTPNYLAKFSTADDLTNSILYEINNKIGVGTTTPSGKFQIQQDINAPNTEPIFEIKDKNGHRVMSVYKDSVHFWVLDPGSNKSQTKGAFAISGKNDAKSYTNNYFHLNADSTRIYTTDTVSGFGIANINSGESINYLHLTPSNYFIGHESGILVTPDPLNPGMGMHNTFIGYQSGKNAYRAYQNTFIGYQAGLNTTNGAWNIFIGQKAGFSSVDGLANIFIGKECGYNFTSGNNNMFIGNEAGYSASANVYSNVFIGNNAGRNNVDGTSNTFVGVSSGFNNTGDYNTFVGTHTGFSNTNINNVFIGYESGIYTSTGKNNVYIGCSAANRSAGSKNVFIGYKANNTQFTTNTWSNSVVIGDSAICTASNQVRLGNATTATMYCQGAYAATTSLAANLYVSATGQIMRSTSSKRYKTNISDLKVNSENIYKLRPVSYTNINEQTEHFGLIAEEVAQVIPGLAEFTAEKNVIPGSKSENLIPDAVQYPLLSVLILKETQKHEQEIQRLLKLIENLQLQNANATKLNKELLEKFSELKSEIESLKSKK